MGIRRVNIWLIGVIDFLTNSLTLQVHNRFHTSEAVHEPVPRFALVQIMEDGGLVCWSKLKDKPASHTQALTLP